MSASRQRKGKACDQCRKSKTRCEDTGSDEPGTVSKRCQPCLLAGYECTYFDLARKRGPPKGYMSALEQRLNNAEALLGAIICSTDARATSLVSDISSDALASSTISRIREGEFGLADRAVQDARQSRPNRVDEQTEPYYSSTGMSQENDDRTSKANLDDVFTVPSVEWQECLKLRIALGSEREAQERSAIGTWNMQRSQADHPTWNAIMDRQLDNQLPVARKDEDVRMSDMGAEEVLEDDPQEKTRNTHTKNKYAPRFPTHDQSLKASYAKILCQAIGLEPDSLYPQCQIQAIQLELKTHNRSELSHIDRPYQSSCWNISTAGMSTDLATNGPPYLGIYKA